MLRNSLGGLRPWADPCFFRCVIICDCKETINNYGGSNIDAKEGRPGSCEATPYPQLLHDPCLIPKIAETENNDGADRGADRFTGGNTGAGSGAGAVTITRISRRCC